MIVDRINKKINNFTRREQRFFMGRGLASYCRHGSKDDALIFRGGIN